MTDISALRDQIVDQTLQQIADQDDAEQTSILDGTFKINPLSFGNACHLVVGPIIFSTPYQTKPNITFGQEGQPPQNHETIITQATAYVPFIVDPYIRDWRFTNGVVDGFYVGLYAKTSAPSGVVEHTVHWQATGKASRYQDLSTANNWDQSYNYNEASFLEQTAVSGEYE